MEKNESNEKMVNFNAWVELIEDRIEDWFATLSKEVKSKFDYSIDSLDEIEKYLIENFELESLNNENNKNEFDAICSYVIKVFKLKWPNSEYVIELNDKSNVLYNRPAVITNPKIGMAFSPFQFLPSIINLKRVGAFRKTFNYTYSKYNETYGEK